MARTHTPRQNKDDSAFEQGSNKTVIVIKNKNAISGCHGNQHSRTPGNVVKHATEHKAAKQVKRLFIRLRRVVQCPLVRAQERHKPAPNEAEIQGIVPQEHHPGAAQLGRNGTGHRQPAQVSGDSRTCTHSCFNLLLSQPPAPQGATKGTEKHLRRWDVPASPRAASPAQGNRTR